MTKPLIIDLPYPKSDDVEKNFLSAKVISPLYTSSHGEIQAILSYFYFSLYFDNFFDKEIGEVLKAISMAEMKHFNILGDLLLKLGNDPVFAHFTPLGFEYYSTSSINYPKTPQKMLLDAISSELVAINDYTKAIEKIDDESVSSILCRIRLDEELHVKALKELLSKI